MTLLLPDNLLRVAVVDGGDVLCEHSAWFTLNLLDLHVKNFGNFEFYIAIFSDMYMYCKLQYVLRKGGGVTWTKFLICV